MKIPFPVGVGTHTDLLMLGTQCLFNWEHSVCGFFFAIGSTSALFGPVKQGILICWLKLLKSSCYLENCVLAPWQSLAEGWYVFLCFIWQVMSVQEIAKKKKRLNQFSDILTCMQTTDNGIHTPVCPHHQAGTSFCWLWKVFWHHGNHNIIHGAKKWVGLSAKMLGTCSMLKAGWFKLGSSAEILKALHHSLDQDISLI